MNNFVSDERAEKALRFLASTDEEFAELEGEMLRSEKMVEMAKDKAYLVTDGTVAERKAAAGTSEVVGKLEEDYVQSLIAHRRLRAKRETEKLVLEVWRTLQANRRMGQ